MKRNILLITLIIIIGAAAYSNSLGGAFIWDDLKFIQDNTYIKNWRNITTLFSIDAGRSLSSGGGQKFNFYRPLQTFTYMVDYSLWGLEPAGYHFTNILFHICAALALFWLICILFGDKIVAALAAILFVAHPIHTEAVSYIAGRADSMSLLFMLLAFVFYLKGLLYPARGLTAIAAVLFYILALLSRETSVIFPALILLYSYTVKKKIQIFRYTPIIAVTAGYLFLRLEIARRLLVDSKIANPHFSFERIPGFFVAITNYVRLLILPYGLHMEYGDKLFVMSNPLAIIGVFLLISMAWLAVMKRRTYPVVFFSIAWFLITLLPSSNIYPIGAYMAEHWLYLPSIGFFLLLSNGILSLRGVPKFRRNTSFFGDYITLPAFVMPIMATVLVLFYCVLTIKQNDYWKDLISFYERTLKYAPESVRLINNLGSAYYKLNRHEEAIAVYKKAIDINPYYYEVFFNLGCAYHELKKYDEAIAAYKKEIEINPTLAKVYNNLGAAYFNIHQYEKGIAEYKKGLELDQNNANIYFNIGFAYSKVGQYDNAIVAYKKGLELDPNYANAYNDLATAYHKTGRYEDAIALYNKGIKFSPNTAEIYYNLGIVYEVTGRLKEAINAYRKALDIKPDYAGVHNNIAIVYFREKEYDFAIEHCDKAIALGHTMHPDFLKDLKPYRK